MIYVAERNALKGAIWSALIMVCSAITIFGYLDDRRFCVASILGAFVGTYIAIKKHKK